MDVKLSQTEPRTHQLGIRGSVLLAGPLGGGVAAAPRPRTAFIVATVVPPMRLPLHSLCKAGSGVVSGRPSRLRGARRPQPALGRGWSGAEHAVAHRVARSTRARTL